MTESKLYRDLMELFAECDLTTAEIASRSGLQYRYVKRVRDGDIVSPGIQKAEILMDMMRAHKYVRRAV